MPKVLTVRSGEANSHKGRGWEQLTDAVSSLLFRITIGRLFIFFTEKVIKWISDNCRGVVFMLWGGYAQKKAAKVDSFQ